MALLRLWGAAVPGEGLSGSGHLCLCLRAGDILGPIGWQDSQARHCLTNTGEHPEVFLKKKGFVCVMHWRCVLLTGRALVMEVCGSLMELIKWIPGILWLIDTEGQVGKLSLKMNLTVALCSMAPWAVGGGG